MRISGVDVVLITRFATCMYSGAIGYLEFNVSLLFTPNVGVAMTKHASFWEARVRGIWRVVRAALLLLLTVLLTVLAPLAAGADGTAPRIVHSESKTESSEYRDEKLRERLPGVAMQRHGAERDDPGRFHMAFGLHELISMRVAMPSADPLYSGRAPHDLSLRDRHSPAALQVFRL